MGKEYLIDTNVIIGYLDNKLRVTGMQFMNGIVDSTPNISVITKIELLRFKTSKEVYDTLTAFVDESAVHDLVGDVVDRTILVCRQTRIKLPDAIIAATSLVYNLTLVTRNIDDFKTLRELN